MIITAVFGILFLASSAGLYVSVRKNLELLDRLENVEDAIDNALKTLDEQHQKINRKSKIEVFSDEPIVRELLQDIVTARHSVHKVALLLDDSLSDKPKDEEQEMSET